MSVSVFELPQTRNGRYSFVVSTGVLHQPYQDHAPSAHRTTAAGVRNLSTRAEIELCPECFFVPAPPKRRLPSLRPEGRVPKAPIPEPAPILTDAEDISAAAILDTEAEIPHEDGAIELGGEGGE